MKYLIMSKKEISNKENFDYINKLPKIKVKGGGFFMKKKKL